MRRFFIVLCGAGHGSPSFAAAVDRHPSCSSVTVTSPPDAARRCLGCRRSVSTPYCSHCGLDASGHTSDPAVGPEVAALLRRFNVGAGLGAGIWTFGNGAPVLGILYWLLLPILPPVSIGIMVYLLINGNRVALQRRRFSSIEHFRAVQRRWAIAGVALFVVLCGVSAVVVSALIGLAEG